MKNILFLFILSVLLSCGKDKVIQLPEINHSEITEITDVSAAYLFYDETQPDSVELNRRNLISTTNWLVNVDKRLTLKQVIPHIKFLQDKKGTSSHKNKNAKNYFTCNDTSRKNLGFIEFTDVEYHKSLNSFFNIDSTTEKEPKWDILTHVVTLDSIQIHFAANKSESNATTHYSNKENLLNDISDILLNGITGNSKEHGVRLYFGFYESVSFQDYITIKSIMLEFKSNISTISNNEFIYN